MFPFSARAPGNVIVSTIAKKQLKIQWDAVPSAELSNTLDHYEYHRWKALDPASITTAKSYLTGNTVINNIYALEIYTEYCFQVNIILQGNLPGRIGNKSDPVCAYTDEGGKLSHNYSMILSLFDSVDIVWEDRGNKVLMNSLLALQKKAGPPKQILKLECTCHFDKRRNFLILRAI